jgi:Arm DNA-binding domain
MRISLTRDFVKKVPTPDRPVEYRDMRLKGLILRVMPTGVKSWYCEYARAKRVWLGRVDAVGYPSFAGRQSRAHEMIRRSRGRRS